MAKELTAILEKQLTDAITKIKSLESDHKALAEKHQDCAVLAESAQSKILALEKEHKLFLDQHQGCVTPAQVQQQVQSSQSKLEAELATEKKEVFKLKRELTDAIKSALQSRTEKTEALNQAAVEKFELEREIESLRARNTNLDSMLVNSRGLLDKEHTLAEGWASWLKDLVLELRSSPLSGTFPDFNASADQAVAKARELRKELGHDVTDSVMIDDQIQNIKTRVHLLKGLGTTLVSTGMRLPKVFWPDVEPPTTINKLASNLDYAKVELKKWLASAARAGADEALHFVLSWYENLDLNKLKKLRNDSKWTKQKEFIQRRQETAYQLASYADTKEYIDGPTEPYTDVEDAEDDNDDEHGDEGDAGDEESKQDEAGDEGAEQDEAGVEESEKVDDQEETEPKDGSEEVDEEIQADPQPTASSGVVTIEMVISTPVPELSVSEATAENAASGPPTSTAGFATPASTVCSEPITESSDTAGAAAKITSSTAA